MYNRQKKLTLPRETINLLKKGVRLCAKKNGFTRPFDVCITLVDNETIARLNGEYRNINSPTDVLSFPLLEFSGGIPEIMPGDIDPITKRVALGDIIISAEKAREQAENYGHSFEREITFLAVHGMLHLLGYDHEKPDEEKEMFRRQEEVLQELGLRRGHDVGESGGEDEE